MIVMYGIDELKDISKQIYDALPAAIQMLNRCGQIDELLDLLGINNSASNYNNYIRKGRILVLGALDTSEENIRKIGERYKISRKRFEIVSEYDDCASFDYKNLQYSKKYCMIMFGPQPHKGKNIGDNSSGIAAVEKHDFYPPSIRVGHLKITKSSFEAALRQCIEEGYIEKG